MAKLPKLAVYALMTPALTLGITSALAADTPAELAGAKEQRSTEQQMPGQARNEAGTAAADRARQQRMTAMRAHHEGESDDIYLSSAPANSFSADALMGTELKSRADDEAIGTISDLLIDEQGQIAAVVVEAGDFLGLGEKNVAISWDAIDRSANEAGDGHEFSVDTTKDALRDAPAYQAEDSRQD